MVFGTKFPARIHVILAREAPFALVIRRGPSKTTCILGWDLRDDRLEVGQWVRARIYELRCDLSPDGRHFLYFALNGKWESEVDGSYTAISKAPYLKAIGLWANGSTWGGGGLFLSDWEYWLQDVSPQKKLKGPAGLSSRQKHPISGVCDGGDLDVYSRRLMRDGWIGRRAGEEKWHGGDLAFEKALFDGWILEKTVHSAYGWLPGKACHHETHRLIHWEKGVMKEYPSWEWADLDRNRLVWADQGCLYAARIDENGLEEPRLLQDLNEMTFEAIPAPY